MKTLIQKTLAAAAALSLAAAAPAFAAPAASVSAQTRQDVVCIAVFAIAAGKATDPKDQAFAGMGVLYFMGRIEGRDPSYDFEANLAPAIRNMQPSDVEAGQQGCVDKLAARGKSLMTIGDDLQKSGN